MTFRESGTLAGGQRCAAARYGRSPVSSQRWKTST
jgi:hypothetical protein